MSFSHKLIPIPWLPLIPFHWNVPLVPYELYFPKPPPTFFSFTSCLILPLPNEFTKFLKIPFLRSNTVSVAKGQWKLLFVSTGWGRQVGGGATGTLQWGLALNVTDMSWPWGQIHIKLYCLFHWYIYPQCPAWPCHLVNFHIASLTQPYFLWSLGLLNLEVAKWQPVVIFQPADGSHLVYTVKFFNVFRWEGPINFYIPYPSVCFSPSLCLSLQGPPCHHGPISCVKP